MLNNYKIIMNNYFNRGGLWFPQIPHHSWANYIQPYIQAYSKPEDGETYRNQRTLWRRFDSGRCSVSILHCNKWNIDFKLLCTNVLILMLLFIKFIECLNHWHGSALVCAFQLSLFPDRLPFFFVFLLFTAWLVRKQITWSRFTVSHTQQTNLFCRHSTALNVCD